MKNKIKIVTAAAVLLCAGNLFASDYTMPETASTVPPKDFAYGWNHGDREMVGSFSQTTSTNGTTITGTNSSGNLLSALWQGAKYVAGSSNWVVGVIAGRSVQGNYWMAGVAVLYNVTPIFAPTFAVDERFNGKTHQFTTVSGGLDIQLPIQPFITFGVSNFWATPYVGILAANGSGGVALGQITETGIDVDLYNFGAYAIHLGGDYQVCQGAGVYSVNYAAGHLAISRALPEGIPLAFRTHLERFAARTRATLELHPWRLDRY